MTARRRRWPTVLVAVLALAICLASCGDESSGAPAPTAPASDPPAPGFHDNSGQTDIPAFGTEAGAAERARAQRVLDSYLQARTQGAWARACGYLSVTTRTELLVLISRVRVIESKTCAEALRLVSNLTARRHQGYYGPARIAALRMKEGPGGGFALFHGNNGKDYWASVKREDGAWKVTSTVPQPLR